MAEFGFRLVLRGDLTPDRLDGLYEAGCDDATFGEREAVPYADFDRTARTFATAVGRAIRDVERVPGVRVVRVEPDDLVSAAAIAQRTGRTRESVRLLSEGERGPGGFPAPVAWVNGRTRVWRWADVARWFHKALDEQIGGSPAPSLVAALNAALELRLRGPALDTSERRLVQRVAAMT